MTQHTHHIETLWAGEVSEADLRQLAELHCAAFPKPNRGFEDMMNRWRSRWVHYDQPEPFHPRLFIVREEEGEARVRGEEAASDISNQQSAISNLSLRPTPRVVAMSEVAMRQIEVIGNEGGQAGTWWTVMTLAQVASAPDQRGTGLGAAVVRASFDVVDRGELPRSLFQTRYNVQPFYERLGACVVEQNTFINSRAADPDARPWWDDVVMRYPADVAWPTGRIDLHGPAW